MRDRRFVAEHRGGSLKKQQHHQLMRWACACAENVLPLFGEVADERLRRALAVAKEWTQEHSTVGEARKASLGAHAAANESVHPAAAAVARAVGHAVATAHMADHALGAAWYALKAAEHAGKSRDAEMTWQDAQLPLEIRELVRAARMRRGIERRCRPPGFGPQRAARGREARDPVEEQ
jgi:hypothetical protein